MALRVGVELKTMGQWLVEGRYRLPGEHARYLLEADIGGDDHPLFLFTIDQTTDNPLADGWSLTTPGELRRRRREDSVIGKALTLPISKPKPTVDLCRAVFHSGPRKGEQCDRKHTAKTQLCRKHLGQAKRHPINTLDGGVDLSLRQSRGLPSGTE